MVGKREVCIVRHYKKASSRKNMRVFQGQARARYVEKLHLIGLNDSHSDSNSAHFKNDLKLWPAVEYGHFSYFVTRPGLYTQEQLLAWKQLDAYNN